MRDHIMGILIVLIAPLVSLSACAPSDDSGATNSEDQAEVDESVVGEVSEALTTQPVETVELDLIADTSVRISAPNKNFGTANTLDINRSLVMVDTNALRNATVQGDFAVSAKLRFTLVPTAQPRIKRNLEAHRMLKAWTEAGATWNCAVDSNTSNNNADCAGATKWSMTASNDAFAAAVSGTAVIPASRTGIVEVDVTADVQKITDDFNTPTPNFGWLLKTGIGNGGEVADFAARNSSTPPKLVLNVRRCNFAACSPLPVCRSLGLCSTTGLCNYVAQPFCEDNNPART
jgi:hypothetical protein